MAQAFYCIKYPAHSCTVVFMMARKLNQEAIQPPEGEDMHYAQSRRAQLRESGIDSFKRSRASRVLGAAAMVVMVAGLVTTEAALAQSYPSKPINAIVP